MSDLLSIGASGVRAYQTALNVVGENISNAGTAGYVRRDAKLTEAAPGAGRYLLDISSPVQGGVDANGVTRAWDQFRAADVRTGTSESTRTDTGIVWLERIEGALDAGDVAGTLSRFFTAGQGLAADPTSTAPRATFLDAASGVASAFRTTAGSLSAISSDLAATAQQSVDELNGLAGSLATVNSGLARARDGSNSQAQLMDERDRILDRISSLASVSVETAPNGVATVRFNQANGPALVQGSQAKKLDIAVNSSGTIALTLDSFANPQTISLKGGSIAGLVDGATKVAGAIGEVDRIANDFATKVNTVHQGGADLDGADGKPLFAPGAGAADLDVNALSVREVSAARRWTATPRTGNLGNASLSAATDSSATSLASTRISVAGGVLTATDPVTNQIVATAAYTPGTPAQLAGLSITVSGSATDGDSFLVNRTATGSRDNGNLAALATMRTSANSEGAISTLITTNASTLSARRTVSDAQAAILDGAVSARDTQSGVSLDSEAVDLLRFQQAYQASSRIIQVSREIFQSILDIS